MVLFSKDLLSQFLARLELAREDGVPQCPIHAVAK
jgi:hypothetical protein